MISHLCLNEYLWCGHCWLSIWFRRQMKVWLTTKLLNTWACQPKWRYEETKLQQDIVGNSLVYTLFWTYVLATWMLKITDIKAISLVWMLGFGPKLCKKWTLLFHLMTWFSVPVEHVYWISSYSAAWEGVFPYMAALSVSVRYQWEARILIAHESSVLHWNSLSKDEYEPEIIQLGLTWFLYLAEF